MSILPMYYCPGCREALWDDQAERDIVRGELLMCVYCGHIARFDAPGVVTSVRLRDIADPEQRQVLLAQRMFEIARIELSRRAKIKSSKPK